MIMSQSLRQLPNKCSRNNRLLDSFTELGLRNLLHFGKDHGGDFLRSEGLFLVQVVNLDQRGAFFFHNLKRPVGHVLLDIGVTEN